MISNASVNNSSSKPAALQKDLLKLRDTVGRVVGTTFFGKLLKTMRESKLKGSFGHGGRGEEVFAAQLHGIWAEQLGTAAQGGIVDALYDHLASQQERLYESLTAKGTVKQ